MTTPYMPINPLTRKSYLYNKDEEQKNELKNTFELLGGDIQKINEEANSKFAIQEEEYTKELNKYLDANPSVSLVQAKDEVKRRMSTGIKSEGVDDNFQSNVETFMRDNPGVNRQKAEALVSKFKTDEGISIDLPEENELQKPGFIQGAQNIVGGFASQIPNIIANVGAFTVDVADTINFFNKTDKELMAEGKVPLSDKMREWGVNTKEKFQEALGVEGEDLTAKIGSGIAELGSLLVPGGNVSLLAKIGNVAKITKIINKAPTLKLFLDGKIGRYLYDAGMMTEFSAKLGVVSEGKIDPSEALISGAIFPGITRALGIAWKYIKGVPNAGVKLADVFSNQFGGVDDKLIQVISENPKLGKEIFSKILNNPTGEGLNSLHKKTQEILIKKFGTPETISKILGTYKQKYDSALAKLVKEGIVAEKAVAEKLPSLAKVYEAERKELGKAIGEFRTGEVLVTKRASVIKDFMNEIKSKLAPEKITKAGNLVLKETSKGAGYSITERKVLRNIQKEAVSIFGGEGMYLKISKMPKKQQVKALGEAFESIILEFNKVNSKITADQLLKFHHAIKNKIHFTKSGEANNLYKIYSKKVSKALDNIFGKEYTAAKKVFRENIEKLEGVKNLLKKDITGEEAITPATLKQITKLLENKEKLESFAKTVGWDTYLLKNRLTKIVQGQEAGGVRKFLESVTPGGQTYAEFKQGKFGFGESGVYKFLEKNETQFGKELAKVLKEHEYMQLAKDFFKVSGKLKKYKNMDLSTLEKLVSKADSKLTMKEYNYIKFLRGYGKSLEDEGFHRWWAIMKPALSVHYSKSKKELVNEIISRHIWYKKWADTFSKMRGELNKKLLPEHFEMINRGFNRLRDNYRLMDMNQMKVLLTQKGQMISNKDAALGLENEIIGEFVRKLLKVAYEQ